MGWTGVVSKFVLSLDSVIQQRPSGHPDTDQGLVSKATTFAVVVLVLIKG